MVEHPFVAKNGTSTAGLWALSLVDLQADHLIELAQEEQGRKFQNAGKKCTSVLQHPEPFAKLKGEFDLRKLLFKTKLQKQFLQTSGLVLTELYATLKSNFQQQTVNKKQFK